MVAQESDPRSPTRCARMRKVLVIDRDVFWGPAIRLALEERWNPLASGDILLLCSDGLCRALADREIAAILDDDPVESVADRLMESALSRGAQDNVSVVVVACQT